jgi:hypothetical protein
MNNLEFIIELLDKLVWPLTIFILLFLLRKPLKELLPFLKKAKISELELEFDREIANVKSEAEKEFKDQSNDWKTFLVELAHDMPSASILEAWKIIENKTEALIHKVNPEIDLDKSTRYKLMQKTLRDENLLETKKVKIFNDLRQIRNRAANVQNYKISSDQALNYISIAVKLIDYMEDKIKTEDSKV